jgi:hypothetical protein
MEGHQAFADEDGYLGAELVNSVPGVSQARAVWLRRKAKAASCNAWENFWVSQGTPMEWVDYWRQHKWSWDTAEKTAELRKYINKEGFLVNPASGSLCVRCEP